MATAQTETDVHSGIALQARVLSFPEVLAQSVANMAPSAAMALLPFLVFLSAGNATWLSFGLSVVVLLVVAYCASVFATRINSAGSFYVWVTRALGPAAGSAAGWGLILGYLFTGVACVIGFEIYGANLFSGYGVISPANHWAHLILYLVGGIAPAVMAVSDIKISQRLAFFLEAASVTVILVLCIAVYAHNGGVFDHAQLALKGSSTGGIVVGMVLAIFAFVGFESAGALGQEAREPAKSVPRAILWSCGVVGVFYLIVSYAQVYGFGGALGQASAPMPQLASVVGLGWLGHVIAIGITCSMFACALACLTAGSRMLLSLGHDGLLPRIFTHTTKHTKAPGVAIWTVAVPMTAIPIAYIAAGSVDTVLTGIEGTLATYGFMLAYALVALAAPIYLAKLNEAKALAWVLGLFGAVTMLFVFYVNWIPTAIPNDVFPALSGSFKWLPYVFLAWTALGLLWYFFLRIRKPHVIAAAGTWGDASDPAAAAEEEAAARRA
jgi:amino acid transporter